MGDLHMLGGGPAIETDVPTMLRQVADDVASGKFGAVDRVHVVIDDTQLQSLYVGKPCTGTHSVGVFTAAAHAIMLAWGRPE